MQTHAYTTPRLSRKLNARAYQRKRYRSFDQAWVNWREQRLTERLLSACGLAGGSVLDVPCGYGRFFSLFTRLNMAVTGVDLNVEMLRLAQPSKVSSEPTRLLCGTIFNLPFADNAFDAVFCVRLFHHQYSDTERCRMLSELARVVRHYVLISFYRYPPLHLWGRALAKKRRRLVTLSDLDLDILAWASGLQPYCRASLLPYIHMQTFAVFRKTLAVPLTIHNEPWNPCQSTKVTD